MRPLRPLAWCWLAAVLVAAVPAAHAATKILVTVVEQKTGAPVTGLGAGDFTVLDDKTPRTVEGVEFTKDTLDIMLLLDTSLAGGMVQPLAESFVAQLQPKEQMAVVSFHSSADLIQDFTSSRELILRAISKVRYGNQPKVLDALYAAIDGGFQNSPFRRVILLLTAGVEGDSRVRERDIVRMARRSQVSIYPAYAMGVERSMFEMLARETGGASFNLREMQKAGGAGPGARVFESLRAHYVVSVAGNLGLGEKLKVELKRQGKFLVSALPLE